VIALSDSQTRDLGVELRLAGASGGTLYRLSSLFGLGATDPGDTTLPPPSSSGLTGVVLNPGDFSAVVKALEAINEGRAMTLPKVLVNNNQEAILESVVQSPFASVNASVTVATTTFGGTVDAGTTISVKPQVTEGDHLVLDYAVSVSTFVGEPTGPALPPPRQENQLQSIVTVPDGYTVVVGGLDVETETEGTTQVTVARVGARPGAPLSKHVEESQPKPLPRVFALQHPAQHRIRRPAFPERADPGRG